MSIALRLFLNWIWVANNNKIKIYECLRYAYGFWYSFQWFLRYNILEMLKDIKFPKRKFKTRSSRSSRSRRSRSSRSCKRCIQKDAILKAWRKQSSNKSSKTCDDNIPKIDFVLSLHHKLCCKREKQGTSCYCKTLELKGKRNCFKSKEKHINYKGLMMMMMMMLNRKTVYV